MLKDSANMDGGIITTKKDPRITPMGGFLRKTKINELPIAKEPFISCHVRRGSHWRKRNTEDG